MILKLTLANFITLLVFSFIAFGQNETITVAASDRFSGLDTLLATAPDAMAERFRQLVCNSLVKKNEKFEYVGELAKDIIIDYEKLTITFTLQDNVKFHNGKSLTSADTKYTLEALFEANGYKGTSFNDTVDGQKQPHILSIETPDEKTLVLKVRRIELINQTFSNLVAIPIIPEGSLEQQNEKPIGTGAFKFVRFDQTNNVVELEANQQFWQESPKIQNLKLKTITDPELLKDELTSGKVDIVINQPNFYPKDIEEFSKNPNLKVVVSDGANIRYLGFNTKAKIVRSIRFRQAVAYAIDREKIIKGILSQQGSIAHSILSAQSWAYSANIRYEFNPIKAKRLLKESGYRGQKIIFKIANGNPVIVQYAQMIQQNLKDIGIKVEIEILEINTLIDQLIKGQFQMTTAQWVSGNQDPIFLRDLFQSKETPDEKPGGRNRWRYSNLKFDTAIEKAIKAINKDKAKEFYVIAQDIVAQDLPLIPLWYPSNIVIANKRIGNISIEPSGNWDFVKNLSLNSPR